ncbi:MAG TPA: penicillin acylase family protein [Streptosporangiaceae bacterium]|nr:penicillin acylase family protein [Streptosporangiaceae bacterium]
MRHKPRRAALAVAASAVIASAAITLTGLVPMATAAPAASRATAPAARQLTAVIRRTAGGTPHILARNWTDLGFGYGYAFAQDNLCTMADDYVTVEGQRSRYFGPRASYLQRATGTATTNLDSDLFFRQIIDSHVIRQLTRGLSPQVRQIEAGYVRGYNRYLASVGGSRGVPDPACRGRAWVRPITLQDSYLRFYQLMVLMGEDVFINGIGSAAPPEAAGKAQPAALTDPQRVAHELADQAGPVFHAAGSNAVAIGSAGTRDHHGLLLGNPHFPWRGPERLYQAQLTIPGQVNVTGASLYGVPLIMLGHTATMAWSHTVSQAYRFTPYQLSLVKGHPTEYLENGRPVPMTHRTVTVAARRPDGRLVRMTRTLWSTRYGPVINDLLGTPVPWTTTSAFTVRDANAGNLARAMNTWFGIDRAADTGQVLAVLKKYQGIPWVNTIVSDRSGQALYADIGTVPGVPDSLARVCDTALGQKTFAQIRLPVLNGSRTACDWVTGPHAAAPGLFGPGQEPSLLRRDFVTNSNDSFWLSNPHHPLTGFPIIMGLADTARSLRTRIGLVDVQARIDGTDGLGPRGFTLADMEHLDLSDTDYAGILTRAALVRMCRSFAADGGAPLSGGGKIKLDGACDVLARWNLRWDTGSRGAVLFSAFWSLASSGPQSPWTRPFAVNDPVRTPAGLNTGNTTVRDALGDAIRQLKKAGIPLDAAPASVQFVTDHGRRLPVPGGPGDADGIYNVIGAGTEPGDSPTTPDFGSSFIQVVTWTSARCPAAATILTYSESASPASPHHADQTALFSRKQWLPDRFCEAQIKADPHLTVTTVTS